MTLSQILGAIVLFMAGMAIGVAGENLLPSGTHSRTYWWLTIAQGALFLVIAIILLSGKPLVKEVANSEQEAQASVASKAESEPPTPTP
jgi:predicted lysophospholipase L1 biosynthesis ABC-type transport system permease subunit